jgi:hypothetical protein
MTNVAEVKRMIKALGALGALSPEELTIAEDVPGHYQEYPGYLLQFVSSVYAARLLTSALEQHAHALQRAAEASDNNARWLTRFTAVVAVATVALVIVTLCK